MVQNLEYAARNFGLHLTGDIVYGWRLRSVCAPAKSSSGIFWLRVVSEYLEWSQGDIWTGNLDANWIIGIRKPRVLKVFEWDDDGWRRQRAEVSTFMTGRPCSSTDILQGDIDLSDSWWSELRRAVDRTAIIPTARTFAGQDQVNERVGRAFGEHVRLPVARWETVHGDLHWANLLSPAFGLLDWELWGTGPAGVDAATLYVYSLLVPSVQQVVHETFHDILDTPDGRVAQIYVTARLLTRADEGDFPELAESLREQARRLFNARPGMQ